MLGIATFAASITYTATLTPRDQPTPAIAELAYANFLFFGVIMGCVLIIVLMKVILLVISQVAIVGITIVCLSTSSSPNFIY